MMADDGLDQVIRTPDEQRQRQVTQALFQNPSPDVVDPATLGLPSGQSPEFESIDAKYSPQLDRLFQTTSLEAPQEHERAGLPNWSALSDKDPGPQQAETTEKQTRALQNLGDSRSAQPRGMQIPSEDQIPHTRRGEMRNALSGFANPLMWLAIGGSLMTRRPMINALTAASSLMQGANSHNLAQQKLHAQKLKHSVGQGIKQNDMELERYNEIRNNQNMSESEKLAAYEGLASGYNDQNILRAAQKGNLDEVNHLLDGRKVWSEHASRGSKKWDAVANKPLTPWQQFQKEKYEEQKKTQQTAAPEPDEAAVAKSGLTPEEASQAAKVGLTPAAAMGAGERYFQTGQFPARLGGKVNQPERNIIQNIGNRLAQDRGLSPGDLPKRWQEFHAQGVAISRFESGPQGNTIRSLGVVVDHLATLSSLSNALENGDIPRFNQVAQAWSQETGLPAPTNFDTAKLIVGTEIIKALGVAGAGTENERETAGNAFNRASSPQQMMGAIQVAQSLLSGQLDGLRRQFRVATGLPGDRFDELLGPKAKDFLQRNRTELRAPSQSDLEGARAAIRQGAPRDKVIEKMRQNGLDPSGL